MRVNHPQPNVGQQLVPLFSRSNTLHLILWMKQTLIIPNANIS